MTLMTVVPAVTRVLTVASTVAFAGTGVLLPSAVSRAVGVMPPGRTIESVGVMATVDVVDVRLSALLVAVGERSCRSVERAGRSVDLSDGDSYPWSRYLRPYRVDDRAHGRSRGAGDDKEVGVGRGRSGGPAAPRDLALEREPYAGAPWRRDDQHVRAACSHAEQQGGQVHRKAPSRQA